MGLIESQRLINACRSTVWEIITDIGNFPVWDSGFAAVSGRIRNGGTFRFRVVPRPDGNQLAPDQERKFGGVSAVRNSLP
jgi:hypothetical protein